MAHCVISAILDTDLGRMVPACVVHTAYAPCPHNGEPASRTPLEAWDSVGRTAAVEYWLLRTHGQRPPLVLRTAELDEVRNQPAAGVDASLLDQAQRDNARLADELACARRDLGYANKLLDEIADEQDDRPARAHTHLYELDPATGEHRPCGCGQPWIRDLVPDGDPIVPDVEPLDQLFARIRTELGEAS